jgi:hypothetical protein
MRLRSLFRGRHGIAAPEFALIAPLLILALMAMIDLTRLVVTALKLDQVAAGVSDIGTQFEELRQGMEVVKGNEVGILFVAAQEVAKPLDLKAYGAVIVTSVANLGNGPAIMWQQCWSGDACVNWPTSEIGSTVGAAPALPDGFTLRVGESALFAEAYYLLQPYLLSANWFSTDNDERIAVHKMRRMAVFRPRFGTLTTLVP